MSRNLSSELPHRRRHQAGPEPASDLGQGVQVCQSVSDRSARHATSTRPADDRHKAAGRGMERMLKKVGYGRGGGKGERERRGRGRGRSADRAISEDVLFRKLLRVLPTPACAEWVTVMEFTKRRFCGRKCDNELYRSNSFKFERFEGKEDSTAGALDLAPARKQVGLV
ncbi:hypothetical protein J6590_063934 [Homalodisca vitripennis]|nr:hypothetical protein J6590_063934 [Homalodisca vitripennis]